MKLNDYLETGCSKELCEEIAKACGFNTLKKAREELIPEFVKDFFKERTPSFYRKGDVGDWKNHFTVAMNEQFDAEYKRRMSNYKTSFKYTLW
ncbi:sulfotransferase 1E1-like [Aplysia californica]|uniref:Sulfotransferase 1E1-like n=1 Tax=Aplysia californica TaxID=6500 RepID=A0ABM1VPW2_APLCA|nr:sulfotransferase 1E1-like [Aplysia californica]